MIKASVMKEIGIPKIKKVWDACMKCSGIASSEGVPDEEILNILNVLNKSKTPISDLPSQYSKYFKEFAETLDEAKRNRLCFVERENPAPWKLWGDGDLEEEAIAQMESACRLPIAVGGALMPDAHLGYGLPIGGVLAVKDAVIPYAVGVDIACRMRITICDYPYEEFEKDRRAFGDVLFKETSFGVGASFRAGKRNHAVMSDPLWEKTEFLKNSKFKAAMQLGTSGSGNHFVEFGKLTVEKDIDEPTLKLKAGVYLALLSHSGSRGFGMDVAHYYSKLAQDLHPDLPEELKHLAWLELDSQEGQDYWDAMELCGRYASANHQLIHEHVLNALNIKPLGFVENHHNFAWKENFNGEELIVHRKGATPAGKGKLGIIPGSMASPGFIVRGKGNHESFDSCSHGAGRKLSRNAAFKTLSRKTMKDILRERDVYLIGGSLDESPEVYKDIEQVMAGQSDLVDVLARFDPKLVRMSSPFTPDMKRKAKARKEIKEECL